MNESHDALVVEVRAALLLDGRVKSRHPERVKTELYRSVPGRAKALGETGLKQKGNMKMEFRKKMMLFPMIAILVSMLLTVGMANATTVDMDFDLDLGTSWVDISVDSTEQSDYFKALGNVGGKFHSTPAGEAGLSSRVSASGDYGYFDFSSTIDGQAVNYGSEDGYFRAYAGGNNDVRMDLDCYVTGNGYTEHWGSDGGHHLSLEGQLVSYEFEVSGTSGGSYSFMQISTTGQAWVREDSYALGGLNLRDDSPATSGTLHASSVWTATGDGVYHQEADGDNYLNFNGAEMANGGIGVFHLDFNGGFSFDPSVEGY